jgi:hypothetical protein
MALTGRFTFRRSFGGKIVLQVEEEVRTLWPKSRRSPLKKRWRDASLMDLAAPELRALIDLRHKPQFMAQYEHLGADEPKRQLAEPRPEESRDGGPQPHSLESSPRRPEVISTPGPDLAVEIERGQSTRGPNLIHSNRMR